MAVDATRCPLCGAANECGAAAGRERCWCFDVAIAPSTLAMIPTEAKGRACICPRCAGAKKPEPDAR
ncbi:MAG: cysteine-rich CWC family protein [Myxococcota bacterium]